MANSLNKEFFYGTSVVLSEEAYPGSERDRTVKVIGGHGMDPHHPSPKLEVEFINKKNLRYFVSAFDIEKVAESKNDKSRDDKKTSWMTAK